MGLHPGNGGTGDLLPGDHAPLLDEGDDQALPHVGGAADHVVNCIAGIHLEQVELFRVGVGLHREDLAGDHVPQVLSHVIDVLHLGGGECEPVDKGLQVQAGKVHKIPDPIHRDIHSGFPPSLFVLKLAQGLQVAAVQIADVLDAVLHHGQAGQP